MGVNLREAKESNEVQLVTDDRVQIVANFFQAKKGRKSRLVIVAPGFAKYKDAYPMTELCRELTLYGDVLCIDFRGVGKSGGRYTFGANEFNDLKPFLEWGRKRYRKNILLGLSLGSYHSFRAAHAWPELVDKILLVSCPSQMEDVLKTFGPIRQGFAIATDWKALKKRLTIQANPFFRWGNPFSQKPKAEWLAPGLRVPSAFLVGGKDQLVLNSLSRKIFENVPSSTSWTEIPEGNHAEFIYLEQSKKFKDWCSKEISKVKFGN